MVSGKRGSERLVGWLADHVIDGSIAFSGDSAVS